MSSGLRYRHTQLLTSSEMSLLTTPKDESDAAAAVVDFRGRAIRVTGPRGSGKTTALIARSQALAAPGTSEATLMIVAPSAVGPVRAASLTGLGLGSATIAVHSWASFVREVHLAHGGGESIIDRETELVMLSELLGVAPETTMARRFARARRAYVESWLGEQELTTHVDAAEHTGTQGVLRRWSAVVQLTDEFAALCDQRHVIDESSAMIAATTALRDHGALWRKQYPHIVFDDFESATFAEYRLSMTLGSPSLGFDGSIAIAGNLSGPNWGGPHGTPWLAGADRRFTVDLAVTLPNSNATPPALEVVDVRHRSLRGAAIVSEIAELLDQGVAHHQIAVVVPANASGTDTATAVSRAALRRGIAVRYRRPINDDPVAWAVADGVVAACNSEEWPKSLRALTDTLPSAPPAVTTAAGLVFALWKSIAPRLLRTRNIDQPATPVRSTTSSSIEMLRMLASHTAKSEETGLDPIAAITHARSRFVTLGSGVEILTDREVRGRTWDAVIVAGYEEGSRPPHASTPDYFDLELLNGPDVPEEHERHQRMLTESRLLSENILARGTKHRIAVSAPEPGVLRSRFLEGLEARPAIVGTTQTRSIPVLPSTKNDHGFWAERQIRASASSLDTFRNCPLEYTYKYVLGISTSSGPQAMVGTITHDILEKFFDPLYAHDRSEDRLQAIFEEVWTDDAFPYLAQAAEYRNTVKSMLDNVLAREHEERVNVLHVERPFEIPIGDYVLSGKIDRIDTRPSATNPGAHELAVVDYKTGAAKSGAAADSLQLGVYYLAAKRDPLLASIGTPTSLALHFLKTDEMQQQVVHADLEAEWEHEVLDTLATIATGAHDPSAEASCEYCEFARVCPTQPQGRVVPVSPSSPGNFP
jgi:RecB family exonuclease